MELSAFPRDSRVDLGKFRRSLPVPVFKDGFPAPVTADLSHEDAAHAGRQYVTRGGQEAFSLLRKQIKGIRKSSGCWDWSGGEHHVYYLEGHNGEAQRPHPWQEHGRTGKLTRVAINVVCSRLETLAMKPVHPNRMTLSGPAADRVIRARGLKLLLPCWQLMQPAWTRAAVRRMLQLRRNPEGTWQRCRPRGATILQGKIQWRRKRAGKWHPRDLQQVLFYVIVYRRRSITYNRHRMALQQSSRWVLGAPLSGEELSK